MTGNDNEHAGIDPPKDSDSIVLGVALRQEHFDKCNKLKGWIYCKLCNSYN